MTRLGDFLKVIGDNFRPIVAKIFSDFLGHFVNIIFSKYCFVYVSAFLVEFGLLFTPTSGHTV